jgi:hypothetical protein
MNTPLSTTSVDGDEPIWGKAELTVEAIAHDGLAQAVVLSAVVVSQDDGAARELIRNAKRAVRTAAGEGGFGFALVIKPDTEWSRLVHVVSRHLVVPADRWIQVAKLADFRIERLDAVNGSAHQEARSMLELPLKKAHSSEEKWANVLEHLRQNDDRWVSTVGAFWWDGARKLTGITQARETALLRLIRHAADGGEISLGER